MYFILLLLVSIIVAVICTRRVAALPLSIIANLACGWIFVPSMAPSSPQLWIFAGFAALINMGCAALVNAATSNTQHTSSSVEDIVVWPSVFIMALIIISVIMGLCNGRMANADIYASLLGHIHQGDAHSIQGIRSGSDQDIALNDITLVTEGMAERRMHTMLGDAQYQSYGSRYTIGDIHRTIYHGRQAWIAPLEFSGSGVSAALSGVTIPGYLWVDAHDAEQGRVVTTMPDGHPIAMRYMNSAILGHNIGRYVQESYPTLRMIGMEFQVDDHDRPVIVVITGSPVVGWSSDTKPDGVLTVDPQDGTLHRYTMATIPAWVNYSITEDAAYSQIQDWGRYVHGWWNATFGNGTDTKEPSSGIQIVPLVNGHLAFYVGIHPPNSKYGNEGFFLYDAHNATPTFIPVSGITEEQAESAIANRISNQRNWDTNSATLYRVYNEPTFLTTVTDGSHNFRGVGLVSAKDSAINVFAPTLEEAIQAYGIALQRGSSGALTNNAEKIDGDGTIQRVQSIVMQGNSIFYLLIQPKDGTHPAFMAQFSNVPNPNWVLSRPGDTIHYHGMFDPSHTLLTLDDGSTIGMPSTPHTTGQTPH